MSDNIIDAAPVEDATPQADAAPIDTSPDPRAEPVDGDDRGGDRGSREAAKYRRQLRDTEEQRNALSERLSTLQRREAERLAAEHLADGADMWRDGLDLAALLDDDGNVDPTKVVDAAQTARKAHPHWAAPRPARRNPAGSGGGLKSGATGSDHRPATSWHTVLNTTQGDD
jgi:hypothetical protein